MLYDNVYKQKHCNNNYKANKRLLKARATNLFDDFDDEEPYNIVMRYDI